MADGGGGEVAIAGDAGVPAAGGDQGDGQQQPPQQHSILRTILTQLFIMYLINSFFRSGKSTGSGPAAAVGRNLFSPNESMELAVYLSEQANFTEFSCESCRLWQEEELSYGSWTDGPTENGKFVFETDVQAPEAVLNNGSLYLHVFLTKTGHSPDPSSENYDRLATTNSSRMLIKYRPQRVKKTANLLTGETEQTLPKPEEDTPRMIISYWHPNLTINVLADQTAWQQGAVPPPMDKFIHFDAESGNYYPALYLNDYWNMAKDYMPINETTPELPLRLEFSPISVFYWQMYLSQSAKPQWMQWMGEQQTTDEEQDSFKETLSETNPYLLGMTAAISLLHTVFEFLAFKNDIQFWRTRKSLEGLSVRTVFMGVVQSVIVLLYVIDNDTNTMVVISVAIGLVIELWKLPKVMNITVDRENKILGVLPRVTFGYKSTYLESPTKKYDEMAFRYLSWVAFPLLLGYGTYSLMYQEHKGWYSFFLGMCYGFLLTFGFIMMTPQLFINYKLKTVAHLPWRMMTYKALNTFIDDIFAFVIKMPMLYRIGCLRDDVIFFIFLYQRWIYRVDHTRVNEFGVSGEDLAAVDGTATAAIADTSHAGETQDSEAEEDEGAAEIQDIEAEEDEGAAEDADTNLGEDVEQAEPESGSVLRQRQVPEAQTAS